jgi:hypothetical protein
MKSKSIVLPSLLTIFLVSSAYAQHNYEMNTQTGSASHDMSTLMGTPTFTRSLEGVDVKVWLIPQKKHKEMMAAHMQGMSHGHDMSGMDHHMMGAGHGKDTSADDKMMKEMMAGTHHIAVELTETRSKKNLEGATVDVQVVSPSGKASDVKLKSMTNHFGGSASLEEKGEYTLALHVKSGDVTWHEEFHYATK